MKKILVLGVFWLLWQIPFAADPKLVEARRGRPTFERRVDVLPHGGTRERVWDNRNYNYYGYAPSGPSWGPTWTFDLRCLLGCYPRDRVIIVPAPASRVIYPPILQPAPQAVYQAEPEHVAAKPSLPDVNLGRLSNVRNYLDVAQASPRERIALEHAILEISDRKKAEFSEDVLRGDLVYLDRLLRKLKRAHVKEEEIGALEDAIDYLETVTGSK